MGRWPITLLLIFTSKENIREFAKSYADDPQVLEVIRLCIQERKQKEPKEDNIFYEDFILTNPVVVDVNGPYEDADK